MQHTVNAYVAKTANTTANGYSSVLFLSMTVY